MNDIEIKLFEQAKSCFDNIELYKRLYKEFEYKEFVQLPFIRKKDLLYDQQLVPPFGSNLNVPVNQLERIHRTSGTSDTPLLLALTHGDVNNIIKTGKKAFKNAGLGKGDIVINCMNYCMWMGGFMDHQSLAATGATVIPYGVGNTDNLIKLILTIPGVSIHATPSYLAKIEQIAKDVFGLSPRDLKIKKGYFGAEGGLSDKDFRMKLESKWGMEIIDANYGMSEVMSIIASEGKEKNGLHFIAYDTLYPELYINDTNCASNKFIKEGAIGELVLSNRLKEAQPLIRYSTGDLIEIISVSDNHFPILKFKFRVIGRSDDMLIVKGINFYPGSVRNLIALHDVCTGLYQFVVPNKPLVDKLDLTIEVESDKKSELSNVKNIIESDIKKQFFVSCNVSFVRQIAKSGNKLPLVVRK